MRTEHNKLVRDLIPEIIQAEGKSCEVRALQGGAFLEALKVKLVEEAREVAASDSRNELVAELADLYQVLETLQAEAGINLAEIQEIQQHRRKNRGGFERKLWLSWVEE